MTLLVSIVTSILLILLLNTFVRTGTDDLNQINNTEEDETREDEGDASYDEENVKNEYHDLDIERQEKRNRQKMNKDSLSAISSSTSTVHNASANLNLNLVFSPSSSSSSSSTSNNPSDPQRSVDMASFLRDFMDMHNDQKKAIKTVKTNAKNEAKKISESLVIHEEHSGDDRSKEVSSSLMDVSNESSDEENEEHSDFPSNGDKDCSEKEYHFVGLDGKLLPLYQKPDR